MWNTCSTNLLPHSLFWLFSTNHIKRMELCSIFGHCAGFSRQSHLIVYTPTFRIFLSSEMVCFTFWRTWHSDFSFLGFYSIAFRKCNIIPLLIYHTGWYFSYSSICERMIFSYLYQNLYVFFVEFAHFASTDNYLQYYCYVLRWRLFTTSYFVSNW